MKKALTLVVLIVTPTMAFAQGTIAIGNTASELVQQWISPTDSTLINVPTGYGAVQFFAAPAGTALNPFGVGSATGFNMNYPTLAAFLGANPGWNAYAITPIGPVAGRFIGTTVTVHPLVPGGNIEYVVIGWTGTSASLDLAIQAGAFVGESALTTSTTGNPTLSGGAGVPTLVNATFGGMNTIVTALAPIPEPTSFALAGLGLAALLVFRRRR